MSRLNHPPPRSFAGAALLAALLTACALLAGLTAPPAEARRRAHRAAPDTRLFVRGVFPGEGGVALVAPPGFSAALPDGRRIPRLALDFSGGVGAVADPARAEIVIRLAAVARPYLDLVPLRPAIAFSRPALLRVDVPDDLWIRVKLAAGSRAPVRIEFTRLPGGERLALSAKVVDIGRGVVEAGLDGLPGR